VGEKRDSKGNKGGANGDWGLLESKYGNIFLKVINYANDTN
jgi:hypothetical protein